MWNDITLLYATPKGAPCSCDKHKPSDIILYNSKRKHGNQLQLSNEQLEI